MERREGGKVRAIGRREGKGGWEGKQEREVGKGKRMRRNEGWKK